MLLSLISRTMWRLIISADFDLIILLSSMVWFSAFWEDKSFPWFNILREMCVLRKLLLPLRHHSIFRTIMLLRRNICVGANKIVLESITYSGFLTLIRIQQSCILSSLLLHLCANQLMDGSRNGLKSFFFIVSSWWVFCINCVGKKQLIHPDKIKLLAIAIKYLMNLIKIHALLTFPPVILCKRQFSGTWNE